MRCALLWLFVVLAVVPMPARASIARMIIVSVPDQMLAVVENGETVASFPVSTSKFGLGDRQGSYATPVGELQIAQKIGSNAPVGAVFHGRRMTGEVLSPNARGRDPIVTRILWLRGLEGRNGNAYGRGIYIHGTAEERKIGRPASYGCIRMRSRDVVRVFEAVGVGSRVKVVTQTMNRALGDIGTRVASTHLPAQIRRSVPLHSEPRPLYASLPPY